MSLLQIVGARIIDAARGVDSVETLWVADGYIANYDAPPLGDHPIQIVKAHGWTLLPALIDLGVSLKARQSKAGVSTEDDAWQAAALSGGVTRVAARWQTTPMGAGTLGKAPGDDVIDDPLVAISRIYAWPDKCAGDSPGYAGHGYGLSCLRDFAALRGAVQYAADHGGRLWIMPADDGLGRSGVMAEGAYALRLGLNGVPASMQAAAIGAIAEAMHATGARAHIASVATAQAIAAVRDARASGLHLTCDVQAHHLHLIDVDVGYFDTRYRLDPPLYGSADRDALRAALLAGDIDAVVSGHVPVTPADKLTYFAEACAGTPALGSTLSLVLALAQQLDWPLLQATACVTAGPQAVLDGAARGLVPGASADFCLVDLDDWWQPGRSMAMMQPMLSPFAQAVLPGRVQATYVRGRRVWESRA
jgi:dihydroorotase